MSEAQYIRSVSDLLTFLAEQEKTRCDSIAELIRNGKQVEAANERANKWIYRGQSKPVSNPKYRLIPSVGRTDFANRIPFVEFARLEQRAHDIFRKQIIANTNPVPRGAWEVLALAQHHGVPTRFMDWTSNPLVALYFAVRNPAHDKKPNKSDTASAIYILIHPTLSYEDLVENTRSESQKQMSDSIEIKRGRNNQIQERQMKALLKMEEVLPFEISENVIYDPPHVSPRIRAQDGLLLAFHNPVEELPESNYIELLIPGECRDRIRRELEVYGVFDKQLFPDLDGLAKWLKFKVFDSFEITGEIPSQD